jgi:drug/metabolite transporter (DMT)-like permease
MSTLRQHWITGLGVLTSAFLAFLGVAFFVDPGEGDNYWEFVLAGSMSLLGAAAMAAGLWGLRSARIGRLGAHALVVVGVLVLAMFWWMMFPVVVAAVLLYAGIVRGGLERELRPGR